MVSADGGVEQLIVNDVEVMFDTQTAPKFAVGVASTLLSTAAAILG